MGKGALADISADVRRLIDERLDAVTCDHDICILFAVESGSRAWGFPSPDSDFDVRFVYAHKAEWYLSIEPRRDVLELPIEGDLDISGWDIKKALQLLIKPNPVLLEWLRSPVVYRADRQAIAQLTALAERTAHLRPSTYHYLSLAESQYRRFIEGKQTVALKKYFYSLRPALSLRWMRTHPGRAVPMTLAELRAGVSLPDETDEFIEKMRRHKAHCKELGRGPRVAVLDALIEKEIALADPRQLEVRPVDDGLLEAANELFREIIGRTFRS